LLRESWKKTSVVKGKPVLGVNFEEPVHGGWCSVLGRFGNGQIKERQKGLGADQDWGGGGMSGG
jgi:hypothetical protein